MPAKSKKNVKNLWKTPQVKKKKRTTKPPRSDGRPPKINEHQVRKIIEAIKRDAQIQEACDFAWVPRTTFYDWQRKNYPISYKFPEIYMDGTHWLEEKKIWFADLVKWARSSFMLNARSAVVHAINEKKNANIALDVIGRRDPRYSIKWDIDHSGKIQVIFWGNKSQFIKDVKKDESDLDDDWWSGQ